MLISSRRLTPGPCAPLSLAIHLILASAVGALSLNVAHAQTMVRTVQNYDIAQSPLSTALNRLAQQASVAIVFDPQSLVGLISPGVQGTYSLDEAFRHVLRGSGFSAVTDANGYRLQRVAASTEAVELGATNIDGQTSGPALVTDGTGSYTTQAITLGKGVQTLRETPQSVTVMTRQLMDDKNLTSLDKVMAQTPGISFGQRNFGAHVFQSRGFALGEEAYLMDGVSGQAYTVTGWLPPDMAIYDRVEVLRGAAGLLVGAGSPGGAVNLVRKRPTAEPRFSVTARAGSWDNYRLDLDGSGKLNDEGTLRGRMVAAYEDKGSWIDEKKSDTPLLYGIVEADWSDDTTLTLSLRRQTGKIKGYSIFNLPRYSDGSGLDVSRSTSLAQSWNSHETEMSEAFAEIAHRFNDDWTSTTSLTYSVGSFDQAIAYARGAINPQTRTGSTYRAIQFRSLDVTSYGLDTHLNGQFEAFGLRHQVTVGANASKQQITDKMADIYLDPRVAVDVFNVNHHSIAKPARPAWTSITDLVDERSGVYANTRLQLAEPLSLVLGLRASWYKYDFDYKLSDGDYVARQNREITPFAGLIYDIDRNWSWYASYADIFAPQSNYRDIGGSPLKPAIGSNYETGLKGELFDKRLNLSLALFYVKQKDVMVEDVDNSGNCFGNDSYGTCYINGTVQRSKGFDLEASGELLPGLQVLAGYTFNMTRSSDGGLVSNDTPKHLARVNTRYTLPGDLNRLTVGAGVSAQSRLMNSTSAAGQDFGAGGRAVWDTHAAWKLDEHWKVSLTAENLFDRKYYSSADGLDRLNIYGDPRTYTVTLRGDFE